MPLTPEQFNKLATKDDLKEYITKNQFDQKTDKILNAVDAVMVKLDNIKHAFVSNLAAHNRFEEWIARLENFVGINQPKVKMNGNP
jgi:hypothetical protein